MLERQSVRPSCEHTFVFEGKDDLLKCYRCGATKHVDDFAWKRIAKGQRDTFCRPCRSAYGKEHYAANRQRYIDQAAERKLVVGRERQTFLIEFFRTHPCVDCGETDPLVLEFDHLADKEFEVCSRLAERNWEQILREIQKCEVVCSNCHRRRTARRRRTLRVQLIDEQAHLQAGGGN